MWNLFYTELITNEGYKDVLSGLLATVEIAVFGLIIVIVLGTLIAIVKIMPKYTIFPKIMEKICDV